MGGWIAYISDISDFECRLNKFRKVFSIEGVPELNTQIYSDFPGLNAIFWAWKKGKIPDIYFKKIQDDVLIFSGVVTEIGHFGVAQANIDQNVERVLELWQEKGEKIVNEINGSFSCLFYNRNTRKVYVFTDRFASRSVWLGKENSDWIVGNYPSTIAALMRTSPEIDPAGLWSFFHAGRQLGTHCLYSNIEAMMAGQKAVLSRSKQAIISNWWNRKYRPELGMSPQEWGNHLAKSIKNSATRYKKVSKSPYLFLSGGLDSRIVAAAFEKPLRTLTMCTAPNAESHIARLVSKAVGLEHNLIVRSPYWYLDVTKASSLISSGIYLNQHAHFIVPVQDVLKADQEAEFLSGDLLENFKKHYFNIPDEQTLIFTSEKILHNLYSYVPYTIKNARRIGRHFNKERGKIIEEKYLSALKNCAHAAMEVSENHADRFDAFLRWSNVGITPTYNMITCIWPLAKERNICFDNELNELSLKIPSQIRRKGVLHKWILNDLNKKLIWIPDANTFLPPILPKRISDISKKMRPSVGKFQRALIQKKHEKPVLKTSGSWLFLHEVYRKDKQYREQIESMILDEHVFPPEIFDLEEIRNTWEEFLMGDTDLYFEIEALRSFGSLQKIIPCDNIDL